jgi:pimeloyl-ACP methyl ester carboxylesterase
MIKNIFAIHGAWSSSISFTYLKSRIKGNWHMFSYDHSKENMEEIIQRANVELADSSIIIGHSLGGIVGLHIESNPLVRGVITLASPLAGLELNLIQSYMSRSSLIGQVANDSKTIKTMKSRDYTKPILHLVANRGYNPFIFEKSDGVLPYKVQTGWHCGEIKEIDANHYEILQSEQTMTNIVNFRKTVSDKLI